MQGQRFFYLLADPPAVLLHHHGERGGAILITIPERGHWVQRKPGLRSISA